MQRTDGGPAGDQAMRHVLALVVLAGLVWSFWPEGEPAVPVVQSPVALVLANATTADKQRVSAYYSVLADVLRRDPSAAKTVGQFRELHARSLDLAFKGTSLPGKYPGLDAAIDNALKPAIGTADVPLTAELSASLVQALGDIANAAR